MPGLPRPFSKQEPEHHAHKLVACAIGGRDDDARRDLLRVGRAGGQVAFSATATIMHAAYAAAGTLQTKAVISLELTWPDFYEDVYRNTPRRTTNQLDLPEGISDAERRRNPGGKQPAAAGKSSPAVTEAHQRLQTH